MATWYTWSWVDGMNPCKKNKKTNNTGLRNLHDHSLQLMGTSAKCCSVEEEQEREWGREKEHSVAYLRAAGDIGYVQWGVRFA